MKLTNADVFQSMEPMQKLMTEKLPVKTAYGLAKIESKLKEQFQIVDAVRNGLVNKYGEKDEQGRTQVKQDSPNWEKFVDEFNELLEQEVELVVEKVKLPETLEIDSNTLFLLDKLVYV